MRRRAFIHLIIVLAVGGWFFLNGRRDNSLSAALWRQVQQGSDTTVDFAMVAPFAWDRLYIFGPYTSSREIDKRLGFHWDEYWKTSIGMYESYNLVMLVSGHKVARWFEHARNLGELEELAVPEGYARADAHFRLVTIGWEQRLALRK